MSAHLCLLCGLVVVFRVVLSRAPVSSFICVFGDFWLTCECIPLTKSSAVPPCFAELAEVLAVENAVTCAVVFFGVTGAVAR